MRSAWRVCINGLGGRPSRSILLALAVALACALISAISCALASLNAGMELRVAQTLGRADLRVREIAGDRFDAAVLLQLRVHPEVELAIPRTKGSFRLAGGKEGRGFTLTAIGVDPGSEGLLVAPEYEQGRGVQAERELVLNRHAAQELGVAVGARIPVVRFGAPIELTLVGIQKPTVGDVIKRFEASVSIGTLEEITGVRGRLSEIAVILREDAGDAELAAARWQEQLPPNIIVQTTAKVTSGVGKAVRANQIGFLLGSVLANLASAFIVLTGLTTGVIERQRELAIMRCLGAERRTLAAAQLMHGGILGVAGALAGIPLGILLAWVLTRMFPDRLPAGLHASATGLVIAGLGAVLAGFVGAAIPALNAGRTHPLGAMTRRAVRTSTRTVALCGVLGLALVWYQLLIVTLPDDGRVVFWAHLTTGIPAMLAGYALLGVPLVVIVARVLGPLLSRLLRLPPRLLTGSTSSAPLRHGFVAAALMLGLALMTDLWTVGSALLRDWLDSVTFPDAFVQDLGGITDDDRRSIESLDFVAGTCAITLFKIDSKVFGLSEIKNPPTNFIAFEPEPFFEMVKLHWIAGDESYARRRLAEGGAVVVAKEFLVARAGYKVGDRFAVTHRGVSHEFEIVGAVSSPGLDVVGYAFDIGREYADIAVGAVFGTREDLRRVFASDAVHLLQIGYRRDVPDREAPDLIRAAMREPGALIGSGREIKAGIIEIGTRSMRVASLLALAAMLIASLGVSNIVLASIDARRFEFGVLRAVGAGAGLLGRLIVGEVLILSVTACVLGSTLGLQGAWTAVRLYELLAGIELRLIPPIGAMLAGCAILIAIVLGVTSPLVLRLVRSRPRELLAATRG